MAQLANGCVGAGQVIRIRQPVDLTRFSPRGRWPSDPPRRILLIGNYLHTPAQRIDQLKKAWSRRGIKWRQIGHPYPSLRVAEEMAEADIVVGYGRSILEAMACGRAAFVHEHCGSDGWVTAEAYSAMEADGFSGIGVRMTPSLDELRTDFANYDPALGRVGHDLVRRHDARQVAAEIVGHVERLRDAPVDFDPAAIRGLRNLAESRFRADLEIAQLRRDLRLKQHRAAKGREVRRLLAKAGAALSNSRLGKLSSALIYWRNSP
jgi:hypothetical protein